MDRIGGITIDILIETIVEFCREKFGSYFIIIVILILVFAFIIPKIVGHISTLALQRRPQQELVHERTIRVYAPIVAFLKSPTLHTLETSSLLDFLSKKISSNNIFIKNEVLEEFQSLNYTLVSNKSVDLKKSILPLYVLCNDELNFAKGKRSYPYKTKYSNKFERLSCDWLITAMILSCLAFFLIALYPFSKIALTSTATQKAVVSDIRSSSENAVEGEQSDFTFSGLSASERMKVYVTVLIIFISPFAIIIIIRKLISICIIWRNNKYHLSVLRRSISSQIPKRKKKR